MLYNIKRVTRTFIAWMPSLQKNQSPPRRGWNYENKGILELRGDDAIQSKQRELRTERQKEYNERLNKVQDTVKL